MGSLGTLHGMVWIQSHNLLLDLERPDAPFLDEAYKRKAWNGHPDFRPYDHADPPVEDAPLPPEAPVVPIDEDDPSDSNSTGAVSSSSSSAAAVPVPEDHGDDQDCSSSSSSSIS